MSQKNHNKTDKLPLPKRIDNFLEARRPSDDILRIMAEVVKAWDDAIDSGNHIATAFLDRGGINPLRDLLFVYGNPLKPKVVGAMNVKSKKQT